MGCCATGVGVGVTQWSPAPVQVGCGRDGQGRKIGGREGACRSLAGASREGWPGNGVGGGVEPEEVVVLIGVAALGAEAAA